MLEYLKLDFLLRMPGNIILTIRTTLGRPPLFPHNYLLHTQRAKMHLSLTHYGSQILLLILSVQNLAVATCVSPPIRKEWYVTPYFRFNAL